jgi:hypothetical protein
MRALLPVLLGLVALGSTGCLRTLHTITAEEWDRDGRAQYYLGYWQGNCLGLGMCFKTRGKLLMCRVRDDNSLDCAEQQSVTEALRAGK